MPSSHKVKGEENQNVVVVYGSGSIGMRYLKILREKSDHIPIVVPTRTERIPELEVLGFQAFKTVSEAVDSPNTSVIICTDTSRHISDTLEALSLTCNVLVEKPLATRKEELKNLEVTLKNTHKHVFVAFCFRFASGLQIVRERLPEIGTIYAARIECQSYLPDWRPERNYRESYSSRKDEGGVLRDLMHEIDYAVLLFGRPQNVFCHLGKSKLLNISSEEAADLLWTAEDNVVVSLRLDYLSRIPRRTVHVFGREGNLSWDIIENRVTLSIAGREREVIDVPDSRDDMLLAQVNAFVSHETANPLQRICTLDEGAFSVALTDAARASSKSGKFEVIQDWSRL